MQKSSGLQPDPFYLIDALGYKDPGRLRVLMLIGNNGDDFSTFGDDTLFNPA
jgi:hypothetical protein